MTQNGAYADVTVKLGLIKLLQKSFDLCQEAYGSSLVSFFLPDLLERQNSNATVQCPVEPGTYVVEQSVTLPKEIPRGMPAIRCNMHVLTSNSQIYC